MKQHRLAAKYPLPLRRLSRTRQRTILATLPAVLLGLAVLPVSGSEWQLEQSISRLTDKPIVHLSRESMPGPGSASFLIFSCVEGTSLLAVASPGRDFGLAGRALDYRVDDRPAGSVTGSSSGETFFAPAGYRSEALMGALLKGKRLYVQSMTPRQAMTADFDLSGITEAIRPIREACAW